MGILIDREEELHVDLIFDTKLVLDGLSELLQLGIGNDLNATFADHLMSLGLRARGIYELEPIWLLRFRITLCCRGPIVLTENLRVSQGVDYRYLWLILARSSPLKARLAARGTRAPSDGGLV